MFTIEYEDYITVYNGKLDEETFKKLMPRVLVKVNNICYDRVLNLDKSTLEESLYYKLCMTVCELVDIMSVKVTEDDPTGNSCITSEKVGSWSTTYSNQSIQNMSMTKVTEMTVSQYLDGTWLRYAGL